MVFLDPEGFKKSCETFVEPGGGGGFGRKRVGVGEGVDESAIELVSGSGAKAGGEEGAGFEGRVVGIGQVEEGELGARMMAEPAVKEGRNGVCFSDPRLHGDVIVGGGEGGEVGAGVGGAFGHEEAGREEAQGRRFKRASCDAGKIGIGSLWIGDGEWDGKTVDERDGGLLSTRIFDGEAETEARVGERELVAADFIEDARAIAEEDGETGGRIPGNVTEAAEAGKGGRDFVPVGVEGNAFRSAEGDEPLRGGGDRAGIRDVELEGVAWRERRGKRDDGFVELAGMVGVGVERGDGERRIAAGEANLFEGERRRELQGDAGEGGLAVVAHGDEGPCGDAMGSGLQMDVEVVGGEGEGEAFGIVGGGRRLSCGGVGRSGVRDVAVFAGGAGEDDMCCADSRAAEPRGSLFCGIGADGVCAAVEELDWAIQGATARAATASARRNSNFMNRDLSSHWHCVEHRSGRQPFGREQWLFWAAARRWRAAS